MKQKVIEHVCKEHIYVAEDGTEFKIEAECLRYEKLCKRKSYIEKAKKIQIKDLDGTVPVGYGNNAECNYYIWYKLRDKEDINTLQNLYSKIRFYRITSFPTIICLEIYDENYDDEYWYDDDVWVTSLDDIKAATENFWKDFGYHISFENVDNGK